MKRNYASMISGYDRLLRVDKNFDILRRPLKTGERPAMMYAVDGLIKDEVLEKMIEFLMKATKEEVDKLKTAQDFAERFVSYIETEVTSDENRVVTAVLSGMLALVVSGYDEVFLLDIRTYPTRGVEEPQDDKVLRGAHDGFTETCVFNTALIRRRIRDPKLTMKHFCVGRHSKTDIVISYIEGKADKAKVEKLSEVIAGIDVNSLSLTQQSLAETLVKKGWWYNPFPKVRYTERPDAAAASILEGQIVVIIDNSPTVMILPVSVFSFVQDTNDYYFPPLIGTYLRAVRMIVFFATMLLVPIWYLMITYPASVPDWLAFMLVTGKAALPVVAQILIFELIMDGLKLASLNTPSSLSNSFSVVGALILGEFAVGAGLFDELTILLMAFVAIGNFTQPSFELGYAFKLVRLLLVILTAIFGVWGFIGGLVLSFAICASTHTLLGGSYLYPLIPFDAKAFWATLVRRKRRDDD